MQQLGGCKRFSCPALRSRPQRTTALRVLSLHKALRKPANGPITAPADAVYECLTLLRRPDLDSLAPFFPAGAFDPAVRRVVLEVGGQPVEEAGPLAACSGFMDTAARRVLPGHLLRRCRVLSSVALGDVCQQRVALTACTGEETVFVWRLRRVVPAGGAAAPEGAEAGAASSSSRSSSSSSTGSTGPGSNGGDAVITSPAYFRSSAPEPHSVRRGPGSDEEEEAPSTSTSTSKGRGTHDSPAAAPQAHTTTAAATALPDRQAGLDPGGSGSYASGSDSDSETAADGSKPIATAWIVESIARDDSHDEEEMPAPGGPTGTGGGPHPRCSPELVVKAQLAALARGDVVGAASFNLWSRSTSGGWELHLSAFRSLLAQPAYAPLLAARGAELGPSALPTSRRLLQEVRLTGLRRQAAAAGSSSSGTGSSGDCRLVFQLGMQANGCWVVEAIRRVADS